MINIDHKKIIIDKIISGYHTEGPLPSLKELNSCLEQMDPQELAKAIFVSEHNHCKTVLSTRSNLLDPNKNTHLFFSQSVTDDVQKIFIAIAQHYKKKPLEADASVDQIFHYFYKALVVLATKEGLTSYN
ncbi:MAG: hypothetical protein JNK65_03990 [Deltaproteobacteria bacterium]|nr:hypothetical protein [Deltaproteobacteria bacterium]